jgi:hypothetical protein
MDDRTIGWTARLVGVALLCLFWTAPLLAGSVIEAARVEVPPVIDGKIDDPPWQTALRMTDFKTWQPDFGKEPSQKTEAYFLYDAENFYVAFRGYDTEPGKIKAAISKRDAMFQDDYVGFFVDPFYDRQNAYCFMVNPLGIQGDGLLNSQGNLEPTLDMVWYSKGQIDDQGFTVEFRIPLQSIRFPNKETVVMGMFFWRQFVRTSEMASVPAFVPEKGGLLTQTQRVAITGLEYHRVVEILPAFTYANRLAANEGRFERELETSDFSLTAKVGITSDLTSDATYNPDFSQVESDAGQVDFNVRYALYYPEKRPFFLEGLEYFQFAGNTEDAPLLAVVYTRNITDPIFGLKATGKLGSTSTIASIYAKDDLPQSEGDRYPDFGIFRFKHSLKDDSFLGGFYTSKFEGSGFNQLAGSDGRFRLSKTSVAEFHLFGSFTRDSSQTATVGGHALGLRYMYENRKFITDIGYQDIGKNFRVDTGFVERTGLSRLTLFSMYRFYPKSKIFQRIEPFYWGYQLYDKFYDMLESFNLVCLRFWLPRSTMFRIDGILGSEVYAGGQFDRNAIGVRAQTQLTKQFYLEGFYRRGGAIYYDPDAPYQGYGNRAMLYLQYQPVEKLDFGLSFTYSDFYRRSDKQKVYDYSIIRSRNTYQVNKYLFLRAIFEYNTFRERLTVDTLASFTYIPGTVIHIGYGSAYERLGWNGVEYVESDRFLETQRGFFFKVSYLWRW